MSGIMVRSSFLRRNAYRLGKYAEYWVMLWLILHGYRILAHRLSTPVGEIDLVTKRRSLIVFFEVKARTNRAHFTSALTRNQHQRILHAAAFYMAKHFPSLPSRFDVVMVHGFRLQHFQNVFLDT